MEHLNNENVICEEQNGFRKDRSCIDHVFTLNSLIQHNIDIKQSVYAAFIDFQKAFDCIKRDYLFSKILNNSIDGKVFWAIKALYNGNKACVKVNDYLTEWFDCRIGVRQGDTLSPTLFSIFINDLAKDINVLDNGLKFGESTVSILLYADDVVLLAKNADDLQIMLNTLNAWSKTWLVDINKTKSKVVHFRKTNTVRTNSVFKVGEKTLEIDSTYKYLGTYFSDTLNFTDHADRLGESGGRALGSIVSKLKKNSYMNYSAFTKLFESCVTPIIDYGAEVWGFRNYNKPNLVQNKAMRIFLGVHRFAPVAGLEGDMAWLSPQYRRWLCILRLWNRLINMHDDRLPKRIFNHMHSCNGWLN
jgi:hypothetical protein